MYNRNSQLFGIGKMNGKKGEKMAKRIRDYGIAIGEGTPGKWNKITDVPGVRVGHTTIDTPDHKTGVTVILPCEDNPFTRKLTASVYVHNGFGKSQGLVQIEELGTMETPIALTNTLNVGKVHDAIVDYMIERCANEGVEVRSINPVVGECNDSRINDIQERITGEKELRQAIALADAEFEEGAVGAGTGTICYGLKGGIGSSSRVMEIDGKKYTLGVLVQTNFGSTRDLHVDGKAVGLEIEAKMEKEKTGYSAEDRGSIMTVLATDLPVTDRQLHRIIRRCGVGIARTGAYTGHGSGEIMIGFTTSNRIPAEGEHAVETCLRLKEDLINLAFEAAAEATEEAILNSMTAAEPTKGLDGKWYRSLSEYLEGNVD